MNVQITGLEQVQRAMRELPRQVVAKGFAKALDRAAGIVQAEVEIAAEGLPEASDTRLSEHVKVHVEVDTNRGGGIALVGFDSTLDERTGKPMDAIASWVEYGHQMLTHDGKPSSVESVRAHPFLRPAAETSADHAIEVFGETLIEELK